MNKKLSTVVFMNRKGITKDIWRTDKHSLGFLSFGKGWNSGLMEYFLVWNADTLNGDIASEIVREKLNKLLSLPINLQDEIIYIYDILHDYEETRIMMNNLLGE